MDARRGGRITRVHGHALLNAQCRLPSEPKAPLGILAVTVRERQVPVVPVPHTYIRMRWWDGPSRTGRSGRMPDHPQGKAVRPRFDEAHAAVEGLRGIGQVHVQADRPSARRCLDGLE